METMEEKAKTFGGDRRSFLRNAGVGAVAAALIMSCKKKKEDEPAPVVIPPGEDKGVDLGKGDVGILNYAYALEQLEAAFYTTVVDNASFTSIFSASEQTLLIDIKAHEIVHREFLKAALGTAAIPGLEVNFSAINFGNKDSVLTYAKAFEDLGVAAYNGAGKLISNSADGLTYLTLAGKIVSVEARHAALIRNIISPKSTSFAGDDQVAVATGLDKAMSPSEVLAVAGAFVKTKINASNLPTS